ncbi:MAG TPA: tetratricopeptide repeat protein [Candidatus Omnitrophota bacterium]|nr:tetratricopeptide repeat protein [Candidatus Omnitrophota bacterium]
MKKKGIASLPSVARNDGRGSPVQPSAMPQKPFWPGWVSIFLIIVLGFVVYANSLGGKFLYDDARLVENNVYIKKWENLPKVLTEDIGAGAGSSYNYYNFYRPIQMITYMIDYSLWGKDPFGFHLTSILLHIAVALALYGLLNIFFGDRRVSFFAALLFAVHPVHTEAVSYIAGRADMLVALFVLLFLARYVKSLDGSPVDGVMAVLCYALALMSKEYALIALPLVGLYHYVFRKRLNRGVAATLFIITVIYVFLRATVFNFPSFNKAGGSPFFSRLPGFFVAIAQYIRLMVLPIDLHMEYGSYAFSFLDPPALAGVFILASMIWTMVKFKNIKTIFFPLAWFLIALIPVSNLYPINAYMAEHWLYIPSMGIFFMASYGAFRLYDRKGFKIPSIIAMSAVVIYYSVLTVSQNGYWKDAATFYERTLKYNPSSDRIYANLATEYMMRGEHEKAIELFKETLKTSTDPAGLYNNLGIAYSAVKKETEAIEAYRKAIEANPAFAEAYNNLGVSYSMVGDSVNAARAFKKAVEINPNYADAYNNLGSQVTDMNEAIAAYERALAINPNHANACYNLSMAYRRVGKIEEADRLYERARALRPEN